MTNHPPHPTLQSRTQVAGIWPDGPWQYRPETAPAVFFTIAYAILTVVHCIWAYATKRNWLLVIAAGCAFESAGNALRIAGRSDLPDIGLFTAMQCLTVITPAIFAGVHFTILSKVYCLFGTTAVRSRGVQRRMVYFFVALDIVSLGVQGIGSGLAASAQQNAGNSEVGGRIVLAGLVVQLVGYLLFNGLAASCAWRYARQKDRCSQLLQGPRLRWGLLASFVSAILVFVRTIFRTVEMAEGWIGPITRVEWYYYVLDAAPVTLAVIILAIWNPGYYLLPLGEGGQKGAGKTLDCETSTTCGMA